MGRALMRRQPIPQLPLLALKDDRLHLRDLRVLAALSVFERKGECSPERKAIAAVTGLKETRVSEATTRLASFGWLRKTGKGGRGSASSYSIAWDYSPPKTVPNSGTVLDAETVPNSGTVSQYGPRIGDGLSGNGPQFGDGFEPASCSSSLYIHTDLRSDPDLNTQSEDSTKALGYTDAIAILQSHGMPERLIPRNGEEGERDRALIMGWVSSGVTRERLDAACRQATAGKRDGNPIGPRYVNVVLGSMKQPQPRKGENFAGTDYSATWSAGHAA